MTSDFLSSHASVSDNCINNSVTRYLTFTINVLMTKLGRAYQWESVLQRQNVHPDNAVAGLPVPLPGLRSTAEPVWSTRLHTFLTVLNFHPL